MLATATLSVMMLVAAKPVAPVQRGPFDAVEVGSHSAGVLLRFEGVTKAQAQAMFDELNRTLPPPATMSVAFFKTDKGPLAALYPYGERLKYAQVLALAQAASKRSGVVETYAFLSPGPRDEALEAESWQRYSRGEAVESRRQQYRDDTVFIRWVRDQATPSEWRLRRWPKYPLAELCQRLGLPGRDALEQPGGIIELGTQKWPTDAGENLSRIEVYLPGGMTMEMHQEAASRKVSVSKVVSEAIEAAREAKKLDEAPAEKTRAPYDEGQPGADKVASRVIAVWLPETTLSALDDAAIEDSVSYALLVARAWRRAHPWSEATQSVLKVVTPK